jgi:hypothetical protein
MDGSGRVREAALTAHAAGLCVVPPREDGSKAPLGSWKRYTRTRPTVAELDAWYGPHTGIGLVCGAVSGGLEMLELEGRAVAEGRSQAFLELAQQVGLADLVERIRAGYQERTLSGGIHLLYRVPTPRPNTKLARRPATPDELALDPHERVRVLIETRGEGGYTIVAPSNGCVHPSGRAWTLDRGGLEAIATITDDEREDLYALARMLDEVPPAEEVRSSPGDAHGDRPGDRYDAAPDAGERTLALLERHGWTVVRRDGDVVYLRRPGKEGPGISASLGYVAPGVLRVFSTSTPFGTDKAYSPFGVYAVLEHEGDFGAAARALAEAERIRIHIDPQAVPDGSGPAGVSADDEDRFFLSPAQVYDGAPPVEWVVPGMIARGAITNLDAKPKTGKTTLALMLVAAALDPARRFLGTQVEFDTVIYLTEQGHDSFKEQLAPAGIGRDVVGRVEIVPWGAVHAKGWADVLEMVRRRVEARLAEARVLLVVDTFSKWSRIADENDATAAMAAYRPLVLLTQDLRLATLVIRHARKGEHDDVTDTARGSNAASGEADIILSLSRPVGRPGEGRAVRLLRGVGRLSGIPDELFIELRDGEYVVLPGGEEVQASRHRAAVEAFLATSPGATLDEVVRATSIVRSSVQTALAHLTHHSVDRVERTGAGRRGDPYRYRMRPISAENPDSQDQATDFAAETAEDPSPATHGHFSAPSHAQQGAPEDGFAAAGGFVPRNPSEHALARVADVNGGVDADDSSPWSGSDEDLVDLARSVFAGMVADEAAGGAQDSGREIRR